MSKVTRNKKSTKKKTTNKDKELVEVIDVGVPEDHPNYEEIKRLKSIDTSKMSLLERQKLGGKIGGLITAPVQGNVLTQARRKYKQDVASVSQQILNAELSKALGIQQLYKVDMSFPIGKRRAIPVTEPEEMRKYVEFIANDMEAVDGNYYYMITGKDPDIKAIDNMFNRAFGKPKEEQMDEDEIVGALTTLHNAVERVRVAHAIPVQQETKPVEANTEPQKTKKVVKKVVKRKVSRPKNSLEALKQAQYER